MGLEGPGENPVFSDPLLKSYSTGDTLADFALTTDSPAINRGLDAGYGVDMVDVSIPQADIADIGAFEFKAW